MTNYLTTTIATTGNLANGDQIAGTSNSYAQATISSKVEGLIGTLPFASPIDAVKIGSVTDALTLAALHHFEISNPDASHAIEVGFIDTGVKAFFIKVPPGGAFVMDSATFDANASGDPASSYTSIDKITLQAVTADISQVPYMAW